MNLQTSITECNSPAEVSAPQVSGNPRDPQARPRWELVKALRKAASGTSTEFWTWWWGLSKTQRRVLMNHAEDAAEEA